MTGKIFFTIICISWLGCGQAVLAQAAPVPAKGEVGKVSGEDETEEDTEDAEDIQTLDLDAKTPPEGAGEVVNDGQGETAVPETAVSDFMRLLKPYDYKVSGRRDPFRPWTEKPVQRVTVEKKKRTGLTALEKWDISELQLLGIIWGVAKPKAMIKDPSGKIHIVGPDTKVGFNEGYIAVIREGEIVVVEPLDTEGNVGYQTRILKIKQ